MWSSVHTLSIYRYHCHIDPMQLTSPRGQVIRTLAQIDSFMNYQTSVHARLPSMCLFELMNVFFKAAEQVVEFMRNFYAVFPELKGMDVSN